MKPLVNQTYLLQKFPGKGGWVYAAIPEVLQNKNNPFGWVKVKGSIDGYEFRQYKLMPMGNGQLFLPVKAEIRKKIGKQEGDFVTVVLYADDSALEIPEDILACFENEPPAIYQRFISLTEGEQKAYLDWIYSAKTATTQADRIVRMMEQLQENL
ncbi:MAG: DUF1905 domain-containing protein [Saprospiraceae bacterium]|nr:DUF1905 domain-containing protein [Saprospiraceae bacterium]